jgi:hypothetical protein
LSEGGNGSRGPFNLKALLKGQWKERPAGPFAGADVERVLQARGWRPEPQESPDETRIYRHAAASWPVAVNPEWTDIWQGDAVFRTICRDLGVSENELVRLLSNE